MKPRCLFFLFPELAGRRPPRRCPFCKAATVPTHKSLGLRSYRCGGSYYRTSNHSKWKPGLSHCRHPPRRVAVGAAVAWLRARRPSLAGEAGQVLRRSGIAVKRLDPLPPRVRHSGPVTLESRCLSCGAKAREEFGPWDSTVIEFPCGDDACGRPRPEAVCKALLNDFVDRRRLSAEMRSRLTTG